MLLQVVFVSLSHFLYIFLSHLQFSHSHEVLMKINLGLSPRDLKNYEVRIETENPFTITKNYFFMANFKALIF